ncbi:acyltransferase family protein [Micrococcaceae bacterium Sec5.7]
MGDIRKAAELGCSVLLVQQVDADMPDVFCVLTASSGEPDDLPAALLQEVADQISLAMAAAAVLVVLAASRTRVMPRWTRALQMLGTVSYALYVWNYVVILWLNGGSTADLPPLVAVSAILLTLLLAVMSWHTVERLGRIARDRFDKHYPDQRRAVNGVVSQPRPGGKTPAD